MPPKSSQRIKPPALQPGDTVGIVAPASPIQRNMIDAGCASLSRLGYKPFYLDSIFDQDLYFAGSVRRRARELEEMFEREEVRAILCARGGYGCNYLLNELKLEKIAAHPKIFVGYSDVTTLLTHFTERANLVTFHGPMVTKDFAASDGVHEESWKNATGGKAQWEVAAIPGSGVAPLVEGKAEGTLYGGCLSLLVASLRTPYEINTADTILFLEDVHAKPFQIDRMLMQLKLAGKLAGVRGLVFGEMLDCAQQSEQDYTLEEVVKRVVGDLGIPVAYGLRSGHVSRGNITLPMGVRASLVVQEEVRLTILEAATASAPAAVNVAAVKS
ncbi:MAG TPA: LD-carboxypeptidase [Terriglobales bacterium]|nr:LD-carboxypeptidase [Terriglobales bacterium]